MNLFKIALPLLTLISLIQGHMEVSTTPAAVRPEILEVKSEKQEILVHFLDLKSSLESLSGTIGTLETRVRSIENFFKDTEANLEELSRNVTQHVLQRKNQVQMFSSNLNILDRRINSTISKTLGLEDSVTEIRNRTQTLLEESREERSNKSAAAAQDHSSYCGQTFSTVVNQLEAIRQLTERTEMMTISFKATFYKGQNMTGEAVTYDLSSREQHSGCQNVEEILQSMEISESCTRVFQHDFCRGPSLALYPKPNSPKFINFPNSELPSVFSVAPCPHNEFQFAKASLVKGSNQIVITKDEESNFHQVPDVVDFWGQDTYLPKATLLSSRMNPVVGYYMDSQGRPEWIWAEIKHYHQNYSMKGERDGLNFAIPPALGGPTNETYNTFPQSEKNLEAWGRVLSRMRDHFWRGYFNSVYASLTFVYERSSGATKPYGFYFWVQLSFPGQGGDILYGFIEN